MKAVRFGPWQFSPTRWPTAASAMFVILTLWLGQWQTRRADEKQSLQDRLDGFAVESAKRIPPAIVAADDFALQKVEVTGEFQNTKTIFIDNRVYHGHPGYFVITPLKIEGTTILVAINRGWIAGDPDRKILPVIHAVEGAQHITGIAVKPLDRVYEIGSEGAAGPVKQNLNLERLRVEWEMALQPVVVQQTSDSADGIVRDWPRPDAGSDMHRAYALQWNVMAAVGMLLWITLNLRKIRD